MLTAIVGKGENDIVQLSLKVMFSVDVLFLNMHSSHTKSHHVIQCFSQLGYDAQILELQCCLQIKRCIELTVCKHCY